MNLNIKLSDSISELSHQLAKFIVKKSQACIKHSGAFHIALSGGKTPAKLYEILSEEPYRSMIEWQHCFIYFTDERFVQTNSPNNNYRFCYNSLLQHVPIPHEQIFAVNTDFSDPNESATDYAQTLLKHCPHNNNGIPEFDCLLLGIGVDGHTASLFPDTEILTVHHQTVAACYVIPLSSWRISLTIPTINHARQLVFMSSGSAKAKVTSDILNGQKTSALYPIQQLVPKGDVDWFIDKAAGIFLDQK